MPLTSARDIIVAIDHAGAKVFRTQAAWAGAPAHDIAPDAPLKFHHQMDRDAHDADREEKYPQDMAFFEQIAVACKTGGRIVLIGRGHGQSNEAHHLAAYLKSHHPELFALALPQISADLSHITDAQLIDLGHKALHSVSARIVL
jgi:phosphoheptose isomerase